MTSAKASESSLKSSSKSSSKPSLDLALAARDRDVELSSDSSSGAAKDPSKDSRRQRPIRLPEELARQIDQRAKDHGISGNEVMVRALVYAFAATGKDRALKKTVTTTVELLEF